MTHVAIQEQLDDKRVDWMEEVSDEQYRVQETARKKLVGSASSGYYRLVLGVNAITGIVLLVFCWYWANWG